LEVGAGAVPATAVGSGRFQRELHGTPVEGLYVYTYTQTFEAGAEELVLSFSVSFEVEGGRPAEPLRILDEEFLDRSTDLGLKVTRELQSNFYASCGLPAFRCSVFDFTFEGGDTLKLQTCRFCQLEDIVICKADYSAIRRALLTSGAEERFTDDFFHLCQSMLHHNWGTDILIVWPEPLGDMYGLLLHAMDEFYPTANSFKEVSYLDENLQVLEVRPVTSFDPDASW
jgi:hypothetical protein